MRISFPDGFLWGSSTSAAQIETASDHNWRGVKSRDGFIFDRTSDHELRREEDLEYICSFGTVYRCGVDWAKLQPAPFAPFNPIVTGEYVRFFESLRSSGMSIMLVLHHFAHPRWFEAAGGWQTEDNLNAFVDFGQRVIRHFGPYVRFWNTFNEPNVFAMNAYTLGIFPPFRKNYFKSNRCLRMMSIAHGVLYDLIKAADPHAWVGISLNTAWFHSLHPLGWIPARFADWWFHRRASKRFTKCDFWGLSYYAYVPFTPFAVTEVDKPGKLGRLGIPHDKMWGYRPEGLGQMLRRFTKWYRKPIIVVESGICTDDARTRIQSMKDYLMVCRKALDQGVDLRGFFYWSTIDNFEWNLGPTYRFGLVQVDLNTKDRRMTEAGDFFSEICRENGVEI
ncbi:MAG TPA: family 1 glycosylhydrolase [Flavilitoribacter sp.]|nr:family 1 glycosylhydrolase [Flavilitoribacter sp.]